MICEFLEHLMYIWDIYCTLFEDCSEWLSLGESWADGPPKPLVRHRGRWGRHRSLSVGRCNDWARPILWITFVQLNTFNLDYFDCIPKFSQSTWKDISKNHHFGLLSSKLRIDQPKFSICPFLMMTNTMMNSLIK